MLHEAPAHLDRAQVRGVGRQELHGRALGFDQRDGLGVLVDGQVVEDDDVSRVEMRAQSLLDEPPPSRPVQCPLELVVAQYAVHPHRAHDAEVLAAAGRPTIDEPFSSNGPAVLRRQLDIAASLIDDDDLRDVDRLQPLDERCALFDDLRALLLRRAELLFFA